MIYLGEIAQKFNLTEHLVHKTLLNYSNSQSMQLMGHNSKGFFVAEEYFGSLNSIDISFKELIVKEQKIREYAKVLIPFDLKPRLYFLLDKDIIVYIGQTNIISSRISTHIENKIFDRVTTFEVNKTELYITEAINILHYSPLYNKDILNFESYFREIIKRA